jgi:hypothetical protein
MLPSFVAASRQLLSRPCMISPSYYRRTLRPFHLLQTPEISCCCLHRRSHLSVRLTSSSPLYAFVLCSGNSQRRPHIHPRRFRHQPDLYGEQALHLSSLVIDLANSVALCQPTLHPKQVPPATTYLLWFKLQWLQ